MAHDKLEIVLVAVAGLSLIIFNGQLARYIAKVQNEAWGIKFDQKTIIVNRLVAALIGVSLLVQSARMLVH